MAQLVTNGALMSCTFGVAPSTLTVIPQSMVSAGGQAVATIMDNQPMANIAPFGVCTTLSNPAVAAATAAALGVLTPQPCIPVIPAPWTPGSPTVSLGGKPALNSNCRLMCLWGGQISVLVPGQFQVEVP
jgi:hypothetical protein